MNTRPVPPPIEYFIICILKIMAALCIVSIFIGFCLMFIGVILAFMAKGM